jgi:transposase
MTNTTELRAPEELLKTDVLGRVQTPVERREALFDEFERSGLSGKEFTAMTGVNYQTFASWMQKRRRLRGDYEKMKAATKAKPQRKLRWMEAVVDGGTGKPGKALSIQLPGGARLEIADEQRAILAGRLIRELGR